MRRSLSLLNFTEDDIKCHWSPQKSQLVHLEVPSISGGRMEGTPVIHSGSRTALEHLVFTTKDMEGHGYMDAVDVRAMTSGTAVSLSLSASWQPVELPESCPWVMYSTKVAKKQYQISIFPRRNMAAFLSDIPDDVPLSSVLLPGTHDTMAFYGWPISQCQDLSTSLSVQLSHGIRVIDIRLALIEGALIAYHGVYPQRTPFAAILAMLNVFLSLSPESSRETVVMSIKQEDYASTSQVDFSTAVYREICTSPGGLGLWYLDDRVPKLGEVRGKVVMFSRFNGWNVFDGNRMGMHPTTWPDSERGGFSWDCAGTTVRTQDWYSIPSFLSIPEKFNSATKLLLPPEDTTRPTLSISFFSASSFPFASPPTIAQGFGFPKFGFGVEGVNSRVGKWLLDLLSMGIGSPTSIKYSDASASSAELKTQPLEEPRVRGWAMLDFYNNPEHALVPLLVECNFRGRRTGEEGWSS